MFGLSWCFYYINFDFISKDSNSNYDLDYDLDYSTDYFVYRLVYKNDIYWF